MIVSIVRLGAPALGAVMMVAACSSPSPTPAATSMPTPTPAPDPFSKEVIEKVVKDYIVYLSMVMEDESEPTSPELTDVLLAAADYFSCLARDPNLHKRLTDEPKFFARLAERPHEYPVPIGDDRWERTTLDYKGVTEPLQFPKNTRIHLIDQVQFEFVVRNPSTSYTETRKVIPSAYLSRVPASTVRLREDPDTVRFIWAGPPLLQERFRKIYTEGFYLVSGFPVKDSQLEAHRRIFDYSPPEPQGGLKNLCREARPS